MFATQRYIGLTKSVYFESVLSPYFWKILRYLVELNGHVIVDFYHHADGFDVAVVD